MRNACWEWTVLPPGLVLTAPHEACRSPISGLSRHVAVVIGLCRLQSVEHPSLGVKDGASGTFRVAATASVAYYRISMYNMYKCAYIPIHARTYMSMYIYTRTYLRILLRPDKKRSKYHIDHWLQNLLRERRKHYIHLSDPEISIKAKRRSHRDHWWQYRASRSMATRHWTIISLMVQCLEYNALRPSTAY